MKDAAGVKQVRASDGMSETADERTDVSGCTWCATYSSLRLLFYMETMTHCATGITKEYLHLEQ